MLPKAEPNRSPSAYQFPRTPHLPGSCVTDDDRTMSSEELETLCSDCEVVIQEKLDGTNVGVFFEEEGLPVCQKRAGLLSTREKDQYNVFRNWVYERMEELRHVLRARWALFGEWLWQTHAVEYDCLPDYFAAFDLLDRSTRQFVPASTVRETIGEAVVVVPELWRGRVAGARTLHSMLPQFLERSAFARCAPEGVYIRFESENRLVARAKCRRPGFEPGCKGILRSNDLAR